MAPVAECSRAGEPHLAGFDGVAPMFVYFVHGETTVIVPPAL